MYSNARAWEQSYNEVWYALCVTVKYYTNHYNPESILPFQIAFATVL